MNIKFIDIPAFPQMLPGLGVGYLRGILEERGHDTDTINPYNTLNLIDIYEPSKLFTYNSRINIEDIGYPKTRKEALSMILLGLDLCYPIERVMDNNDINNFFGKSEIDNIIQSWINFSSLNSNCYEYDNDIIEETYDIMSPILNKASKCDVVAFPIFQNIVLCASIISKLIKNLHPCKIVWGGPHIMFDDRISYYLENKLCDIAVIGEADWTIGEIIENAYFDIIDIDGACTINDDKIKISKPKFKREYMDLDTLPFPIYDGYLPKEKMIYLPVHTSRSCTYRCLFCGGFRLPYRAYRTFSSDRVVDELEYLMTTYPNLSKIMFADSAINHNKERFNDFCIGWTNKYKSLGYDNPPLKLKAEVIATPDKWDNDIISNISLSGFKSFLFGIESFMPIHRKYIPNKIYDAKQVSDIFNRLNTLGVHTHAFYMIGFPGDTKIIMDESINILEEMFSKLGELSTFTLSPMRPDMGSPLMKIPEKYGITIHSFTENIRNMCKAGDTELKYKIDDEFKGMCLLSVESTPEIPFDTARKLSIDRYYSKWFEKFSTLRI